MQNQEAEEKEEHRRLQATQDEKDSAHQLREGNDVDEKGDEGDSGSPAGKVGAEAAPAKAAGAEARPPPRSEHAPTVHNRMAREAPWTKHKLQVLKRKVRDVCELETTIDVLNDAVASDMASQNASEKAEFASYVIGRLSLVIVESTCRMRRVVHPPLYSRLFPARRRID